MSRTSHATAAALVVLVISTFALAASAPPPEVRSGIWRGVPIIYKVANGRLIFQGDMLLDHVGSLPPKGKATGGHQPGNQSFGSAYSSFIWPINPVSGVHEIPYAIDSNSDPNATPNINAAVASYNATFSGLIQWVPYSNQPNWVDFDMNANDQSGSCQSAVGDTNTGEQFITGSGACSVSTFLHEMGHSTGLWHEQSRFDRNSYVNVNYNNMIRSERFDFDMVQDNGQNLTYFYDYGSVMEYFSTNFTRNGGFTIDSIPSGIPLSNTVGYTAADVEGIQRLYSAAPTAITVTTNPPGLPIIVDGTNYTAPQTFNWALNSNHTLSVPNGVQELANQVIGTPPNTAVVNLYYIYGRWNDSTSQTHTITVAPGNGFGPFPVNVPLVSTYTANYISLVPYSASVYPDGSGSVAVSPQPVTYSGSNLQFFTARQQVTLMATPANGWNFYGFYNSPFWLQGGLSGNPKTFYAADWGNPINTATYFSNTPVFTFDVQPGTFESGLWLYIDGGYWPTPVIFSSYYDGSGWAAGEGNVPHNLSFTNPEQPFSYATRFSFDSWNLNGTNNSNPDVTLNSLPANSASFIANEHAEYMPIDNFSYSCGGSATLSPGSPTGDGFYPTGQILSLSATPLNPWLFAGWTYDLTGTGNPQNYTLNDEALIYANFNMTTTPLSVTGLLPPSATAGGGNFTLTVNGTGFVAGASGTQVILVFNPGPNATYRTPALTFVNSNELQVQMLASDIANPGAMQVWVNEYPAGWNGNCSVYSLNTFLIAASNGAAIVSASPTSATFKGQAVGTNSAAQKITVTNTGTLATSLAVSSSGDFKQTNNCNGSLSAGASCTINVSFNPTNVGTITGSITLTDSAANSPQIVNLTGNGITPASLSPTGLSFGNVNVGTTSAPQTVTLTNNEPTTLSFTFAASGNYSAIGSGTSPCGTSLAAGAKCTMSVTFTPTANGAILGAVTVADTTIVKQQTVALSGTGKNGQAAPLTFSPTTVTFGNQAFGTTSAPQVVTVKNVSTATVTLSSIAASGNFVEGPTGTTPCKANTRLNANATCTMNVAFLPYYLGSLKGAVVVTDNATVNQQVLNVGGTGLQPVGVSPTSLTFAAQAVGTTSQPQTVTITNNLPTTLNNIAASASGDFAITANTCPASLPANGQCSFGVTFTPSQAGAISGAASIVDTAVTSPQVVNLGGTGQ